MPPQMGIWEIVIEVAWDNTHGFRQTTHEMRVVRAGCLTTASERAAGQVREIFAEEMMRTVSAKEIYAAAEILQGD